MIKQARDWILSKPKTTILIGITIIVVSLALISCAPTPTYNGSIGQMHKAVGCKSTGTHQCGS